MFPQEPLEREVCLQRTLLKSVRGVVGSSDFLDCPRQRRQLPPPRVPSSKPVTSQSINMRSASLKRMFLRRRRTAYRPLPTNPVMRNFGDDLVDRKHPGREPVIEVGRVVGDLIGEVDDLRFERRTLAGPVFVQFRMLAGLEIARVLNDSFAHLESEIQAGKSRVALLEVLDDAEGVQIVVEAVAEPLHLPVQFFFTGMRERRVTDVVCERQSFSQILVQAERGRDRASDLGDFDRVGEAVAKMVVEAGREDLRLVLQAPECARVDDAVAVTLELVAIGMG